MQCLYNSFHRFPVEELKSFAANAKGVIIRRGQQPIGPDFIRMLAQSRLNAAAPHKTQLGIDVNDIDAGRDRGFEIAIVGPRRAV